MAAAALTIGATPAAARPVRTVTVAAIKGAPIAAVATIRASKVTSTNQQGNQRIETLVVTARVDLAIKGTRRGARLRFTHLRAAASTGLVLNGFSYLPLLKGHRYLLLLAKRGRLQLYAPEDRLVEIPARALRDALKVQAKSALRKAMALLHARVRHCGKGCGKAIWLLTGAPRALRLPKKRVVALLRPLARTSKDANTRLAAYTVLGRHGVKQVIPEIVAYIGSSAPSGHRANAISWLQGFPKKAQITALKQILLSTRDVAVRRAVGYRLRHLTK